MPECPPTFTLLQQELLGGVSGLPHGGSQGGKRGEKGGIVKIYEESGGASSSALRNESPETPGRVAVVSTTDSEEAVSEASRLYDGKLVPSDEQTPIERREKVNVWSTTDSTDEYMGRSVASAKRRSRDF